MSGHCKECYAVVWMVGHALGCSERPQTQANGQYIVLNPKGPR